MYVFQDHIYFSLQAYLKIVVRFKDLGIWNVCVCVCVCVYAFLGRMQSNEYLRFYTAHFLA